MYFKRADELLANSKNYLPTEMQINMSSPKGKLNTHTFNERPQRRKKGQKEVGIGPNETDARVRNCF